MYVTSLLLALIVTASQAQNYRPCAEISRELRLPCQCALGPIEAALDGNPSVSIDCDGTVFPGEFPSLPFGAPITTYRHRWAGYQALPMPLFTQLGFPLRSVDFSGNSLRRLTERLLQGLQTTLLELRLADNLLGDTLNPIFASSEFHGLKHLQLLDLSGNGIKAIEEGILEGCEQLQTFHINRNSLTAIPGASLNGPKSLKILSIRNNRINNIKSGVFQGQMSLDTIDLGNNQIGSIDGGAFAGLKRLRTLRLTHNRLSKLNSDVFDGATHLQQLDMAENFLSEFPAVALKTFQELRYLNLSSNMFKSIDNNDLASLTNLYHLDLSRNNIANIVPGTFLGMKQLRKLDISVNSLRTIEDDAFEGLDNLESLNLKDNNVLLVPASALGRLPQLTHLQLDYNRVAALSSDILSSLAGKVTNLVIARNVVRELPSATFENFKQLQHLDLTRNLLSTLNTDAFSGLANTLLTLQLSQNKIATIAGPPLRLSRLQKLDLSDNQLTELAANALSALPSLQILQLAGNSHLATFPATVLHPASELIEVDLSRMGLRQVNSNLFAKSYAIQKICLQDNALNEIGDSIFANLRNLTVVNLSNNKISNIRPAAFVNVMNIRELYLQGNQLSSFKGEFFNTGTSLEVLDISNNQLSYLFPSSFRIHPRLRRILSANNKFNFFPSELIATLQYLEYVDLSGNSLKTIEELDFARLPRLRSLLLADNRIELISEMAFHNSTQLQVVDLAGNKLDRLGERSFEGLVRLERLNLERNLLTDLPEMIFERSRLQMLENINLAHNLFEIAPLKALQRQYFFVSSVDLSHNRITEIPADDSVMVNIKRLDLSFNPLSEQAVINVLGEPKTVREINLAGTGIVTISQLETPFLHSLNLSHNNISEISPSVFERTTLLESLDLSHNKLQELSGFTNIWTILRSLQSLNISSNPLTAIANGDFDSLGSLQELSVYNLEHCVRIEKTAFRALPNLKSLDAYDYPKLGYLDIQGLLQYLPALERVNIETKDAAVGSDQLQSVLNSRLKELGIHGNRLRSVSSGTLSGLKVADVMLRLKDTSLTTLPPALFFPVPRSSHITLDLAGNQLTALNPQLLATLDDRRGDLRITGLEQNPIVCDCNARALRRWLPSHMSTVIKCTMPEHLAGKLLVQVGDDELTCDQRKLTPSTSTTVTSPNTVTPRSSTSTTRLFIAPKTKTTEPEIIWSLAPSTARPTPGSKQPPVASTTALGNDDTLIISIVGGVVAFITILIIVICIIRLRMGSGRRPVVQQTPGGAMMAAMGGPGSTCASCSVKGGALYALPPPYGAPPPAGYATATLPHGTKIPMGGGMGTTSRPVSLYGSTIGRVPYGGGPAGANQQPYFIAAYPSDEKIYR